MRGSAFFVVGACLIMHAPYSVAADGRAAGQALLTALQQVNVPLAASLIKQGTDVNVQDETGATPLIWATQRRDPEIAKKLLAAGANPNLTTSDGISALQVALDNEQSEIALLLLDKGAKVNVARDTGETPLMTAARTGQLEVMKRLVDLGADVNASDGKLHQTALMWSAGYPEQVKLLIAHGADLRARTTVWDVTASIYTPSTFTVGITGIPWNNEGEYVSKKGGQSALLFAVQKDDMDSVRLLLDAGVDVNDKAADGSSALLLSLYKWNVEYSANGQGAPRYKPNLKIANLLLDRGAEVNVADSAGYTPLHGAVLGLVPRGRDNMLEGKLRGDGADPTPEQPPSIDITEGMAVVKRLLDKKANANAMTQYPTGGPIGNVRLNPAPPGSTPLHIAGISHNAKLAELLVAYGADPNLLRQNGHTPFSVAVRANDLPITKVLAEHGANLKMIYNPTEMIPDPVKPITRPRTNQTILHIAAAAGSNDVIEYLVKHGVPAATKNGQGETPLQLADDEEVFRHTRALEVIGTQFDTKKVVQRVTVTSDLLKKITGGRIAKKDNDKPAAAGLVN